MADAYRGLTLRIGADTRPLRQALSSAKQGTSELQTQLRAVKKALALNPGNLTAANQAMRLLGDKAALAARQTVLLRTAMKQAGESTITLRSGAKTIETSLRNAANATTNVFTRVASLRSEYTGVNRQLETYYDHVARAYQKTYALANEGKTISFQKAVNYVKDLAGELGTASARAKEFRSLLFAAFQVKSAANPFGLECSIRGANRAYNAILRLRQQSKLMAGDLEALGKIQGFTAIKAQLVSIRETMRQDVMEANRMKNALFMRGGLPGLSAVNAKIDSITANLSEVRQHVMAVNDAFEILPPSIEAARAKVLATQRAESAMKAEIDAIREKIAVLRNTPGFEKIANSSMDAYAAVSRLDDKMTKIGMATKEVAAKTRLLVEQAKNLKAQRPDGWEEKLEEINREIEKCKNRLKNLKSQSDKTFRAFNAATAVKEVEQLEGKVIVLQGQMEKLKAKTISLVNVLSRIGGAMKNVGYALMSTIGPAMMMAVRYAITAANDIDAAYRDMRKTVNGTEEEFEHLYDAALKFSQTHFTSAEQILEIEAIGGQLAILPKNLEAFSEVVSNLGIATNVGTEDWATYIGQLSNIMRDIRSTKNDTKEYEERITSLSDAIVRLGNNSATQESNIMKVVMRMASLGTISGFSTPELLGIATAVAATGQGAEAAGTAIARTFSIIEKAVAGADTDLNNFAHVAGVSAEEFAYAWGHEPMEAFKMFIGGLKRLDAEGDSIETWLAKLKINSVRTKQAINGLVETFDILTQAEEMAEDAWNGTFTEMEDGSIEYAGDAAREAARKAEGFSGALQQLKNNLTVLASEFGKSAYPVIVGLKDALMDLVDTVKQLPESLKLGIVAFMGLTAVAPAALVAIGMPLQALVNIVPVIHKVGQAFMLMKARMTAGLILSTSNAAVAMTNFSLKAAAMGLTLGKTVAIVAAAAVVIGLIAKAFIDAKAKTEKFEKATSGLSGTVNNLSSGFQVLNTSMTGTETAFDRVKAKIGLYGKVVDEAVDRNASLADSFTEQASELKTSASLAKKYGDRIKDLAGNCEGSSSKMRQLKEAISQYNDITGSSIKIVDNNTGAINLNSDALDRNTESYVLNAHKRAYEDMLSDIITEGAKLEVAYDEVTNDLETAMLKRDELIAQGRNGYSVDENGIAVYDDSDYADALKAIEEQTAAQAELAKLLSTNAESERQLQLKIDGTARAAENESIQFKQSRHSLEEYNKAIANAGMADDFIEKANTISGSLEEFAKFLSEAGISGEQFVNLGIDGFDRLYQAANGDASRIEQILTALGDLKLDPKEIVFNEDGLPEINEQIIKFDDNVNRLFVGEYTFRVTDDGSLINITNMTEEELAALEAELEELDGTEAETSASFDDEGASEDVEEYNEELGTYDGETVETDVELNASQAFSLLDELNHGLSVLANTTTTHEVQLKQTGYASGGNAAGGISSIPVNASGGLNGIITRAMLTNVGWVGEDGDEALIHMRHAGGAIIPLSNRQHVRPFAQAVAAEMHPYTGYQPQGQITYNINVTAGSDGEDIARTITRAIRQQELMGRR